VFHRHLASHITVGDAFEADRRRPPARSLVLAHNTAGAPAAAGAYDTHATHGAGGVPDRPGPDGARQHMGGASHGDKRPGARVGARGARAEARRPPRRPRANVHGELPGYAYLLGGTPAKAAPD
jgi:hypothetical protein